MAVCLSVCRVMWRPAKSAPLMIRSHGFARSSVWPDFDEREGNSHGQSVAIDCKCCVRNCLRFGDIGTSRFPVLAFGKWITSLLRSTNSRRHVIAALEGDPPSIGNLTDLGPICIR